MVKLKKDKLSDGEISKMMRKFGIGARGWTRKEGKIFFRRIIPEYQGIERRIADEVARRHGKKIEHYDYTPEDMSRPLEEYYYIEFSARPTKKSFKESLKESERIKKEIEDKINRVVETLFRE